METENPYTTPTAEPLMPMLPDEANILAERGDRFVGAFIDGLVNTGIVLLLFGILMLTGLVKSFSEFGGIGLGLQLSLSAGGFMVFLAINWHFLSTSGQTIGKRVAKTRIVTMDGKLPSMTGLVGKRYAFVQFVNLIPVVGSVVSLVDILFIFRKDRRCLHDLIAGTQVFKVVRTS